MLDPKYCQRGQEQFEGFVGGRRGEWVQYDYRHLDGELFSCIKRTLDECRKAKDAWLAMRADTHEGE